MLTVYTVSSALNTGAGTLRDAITQANSHSGADQIIFAPQLSGQTILLTGSELAISGDLKIDATSLPGGVTIDGNNAVRAFNINGVSSVELDGLTFRRGYTSGIGAILNSGTLVVNDCTFVDNNGTPIWNSGTVTVSRSYFHHNLGTNASGLYNQGKATIVDSTFAENGSGPYKSPVIATSGSSNVSLTIERSTIGGDASPYDSDGQGTSISDRGFTGTIYQYTVRVAINNSVVIGNVDAAVQAKYSLLSDVEPTYVAGTGYILNVDPQLGPLADNGGPTPTYAVLPSSPALNAGDPAFVATTGQTDQRGGAYQRAVGRLDMGAYEAQATPTHTPGDFNGDGRVDAADYLIWRINDGATVSPLTAGDATGDGVVDDADYRTWRADFGFIPLGGKLVVNDLGDRDDGDIYNGRLTLREAIDFSKTVSWADSITFDPSLSGGVINIASGYMQIEKALTIDARMLPSGITLDAGGNTIGLHINAFTVPTPNDFDVTLAGLSITGGVGDFGGGGAIDSLTTGKLTVIDCQLLNNNSGNLISSNTSSAIYAKGALDLIDTVIDGGVAFNTNATGGAVYALGNIDAIRSTIRNVGDATYKNVGIIAGGNLTLTDSEITATTGGGVNVQGNVLMTRSHIENTQGPGVFAPVFRSGTNNALAGNVTLVDSTVSNNTSQLGTAFQSAKAGNGIDAGGSVVLTRSRVENNRIAQTVNNNQIWGGGISAYGHVIATDSFINGNNADMGGGIYAFGRDAAATAVAVSLIGTEVSNNESHSGGAAVEAQGSVSISGSTLSGNSLLNQNTSITSGIVMLDFGGSGVTLSIADSILSGNSAYLNPYYRITNSAAGVTISITRTQIVDNQMNGVLASSIVDSTVARNLGTGVYGSNIDITGSTISDNGAGGVSGDAIHIKNSTVRGNVALGGGAGAFGNSSIVVESSLIADNHTTFAFSPTAPSSSGGLSANRVVVVNSTVRDNSVSGPGAHGGGINSTSAYVYGSTISGNLATSDGALGGGVYTLSGTFKQSTISGNRVEGASAQGGGIWVSNLDAMQITVADNGANGDSSEAGGIYAGTVSRLVGGVVVNNIAATGAQDLRATSVDPTSTLPGVAYSLIRDPNGSPLVTGGGGVGNLLGIDPLLGPLADNGGSTLTYAPLPGSPLIDAGDPALTAVPFSIAVPLQSGISISGIYDQRDAPYSRVVDGGSGSPRIDMGAVEVQSLSGGASLFANGMRPFAPTTSAASPKSTAAAVDAALAAVPENGLLLLMDPEPLIAERSGAPNLVGLRSDDSSTNADAIAIESVVEFLPVLKN